MIASQRIRSRSRGSITPEYRPSVIGCGHVVGGACLGEVATRPDGHRRASVPRCEGDLAHPDEAFGLALREGRPVVRGGWPGELLERVAIVCPAGLGDVEPADTPVADERRS